jgi:hypothetical protein
LGKSIKSATVLTSLYDDPKEDSVSDYSFGDDILFSHDEEEENNMYLKSNRRIVVSDLRFPNEFF